MTRQLCDIQAKNSDQDTRLKAIGDRVSVNVDRRVRHAEMLRELKEDLAAAEGRLNHVLENQVKANDRHRKTARRTSETATGFAAIVGELLKATWRQKTRDQLVDCVADTLDMTVADEGAFKELLKNGTKGL